MRFPAELLESIQNQIKQIDALLDRNPGVAIALEPTSTYHMLVAERAFKRGHTVYLVNPRDLKHFRESHSFRAKTDKIDAWYIGEYVRVYATKLRPWAPMKSELRKLKSAIRQWFHASHMRTKLAQVFEGLSSPEIEQAVAALEELSKASEKRAIECAKIVDAECYARMKSAAGVGKLSACAFTFLYRSKQFETPDAVRAFVGLDLRVSDSGKSRGKRFLTKRGDRIIRYAVTCAGRGLLNSKLGSKANEDLKARGRAFDERMVIASRKVIRTTFALDKQKTRFDPKKFMWRVDTGP